MDDNLTYNPNDYTPNYPLQLTVKSFGHLPTNQNSLKFLNLLSQQIRKRNNETLGTSVINSPMTSPSHHTTLSQGDLLQHRQNEIKTCGRSI